MFQTCSSARGSALLLCEDFCSEGWMSLYYTEVPDAKGAAWRSLGSGSILLKFFPAVVDL